MENEGNHRSIAAGLLEAVVERGHRRGFIDILGGDAMLMGGRSCYPSDSLHQPLQCGSAAPPVLRKGARFGPGVQPGAVEATTEAMSPTSLGGMIMVRDEDNHVTVRDPGYFHL
jgi:hypothetical protein